MRNVSDESCRENQNTCFMFITLLFLKSRLLWDNAKKNIVQPVRQRMMIWRVGFACWIPKSTNTHSECIILIVCRCNNGCTNAPHCYVIPTLPVFLYSNWSLVIYLQRCLTVTNEFAPSHMKHFFLYTKLCWVISICFQICTVNAILHLYRVSREECARLRENVP